MDFIICDQMEWRELEEDFFEDSLPEDVENEELLELIKDFNLQLMEIPTNCWAPGMYRAILKEG